MTGYLDAEGQESEGEGELDVNEKKKLKKLRMKDSDDDDEDDDDEEDEGEISGFINDDNDDEDSEDSDHSKKRKKSDDEDFDDRLEDEDYDLLEENLGVKVERKRRFKRLRRIQDEESEEEKEEVDDERDAIANELFEGSGEEDAERNEISPRDETEDFDEEESDDEDDFIVDDDGIPITEKRKRKKSIFSDAALQEAQNIFGVDFDYEEFGKYRENEFEEEEEEEDEYIQDEIEDRRKRSEKNFKKKSIRKSIFELYEPSELIRGHFTDVDNEIRITDIPERMQIRAVPVIPTAEGSDELDFEANWIYKQAFCQPTISIQDTHLNEEAKERAKKGPHIVDKIRKVLDFIRNQNFEVPFISFYRKEYVSPELNINDLWKIYKFDVKWYQLKQRKENLLKLFKRMRNFQLNEIMKNPDASLPENIRVIKDDDIKRLKNIQTFEELNDIYQHFMLYYNQSVSAMQEDARKKEKKLRRKTKLEKRKQFVEAEENEAEDSAKEIPDVDDDEEEIDDSLKQPVRKGPYYLCKKAGLDGLAKKFGLSPEQFAENVRDNYQRHEIDQDPTEPAVVANDFYSVLFKTSDEILKAAQLMVAIQLAYEPLVRKCIREMYMERAKISVKPTKKGMKEIDEGHAIYSLKYLKNKPVRDFVGDQFLKLIIAEQDKLITLSFSDMIEGNTSNNCMDEMKQLYYKDEFSKSVQDWNALRTGSVEIAFNQIIIPQLKKELRSNLLAEAKEYVMKACCRKMYNWIKIAPYTCEFPNKNDEDWDTSKGIRVMALAYVPDPSQAAFTCIISPEGKCTDYLKLPHLLKRKNRENEKTLKEADLLVIKNFIATKKPHVVIVGGESREALTIVSEIKECIFNLAEQKEFPAIQVEICDNEFAKVYANCSRSISEFRDYPELLRQAISLARKIQDPLLEFSQLCTIDEEILCLKYHPLQDQLSTDDLIENLYLEFINRVNEVGVDLNRAIQQPHTANLVQFVCGLGPRKGQALIKILKQTNQRLENRTQLITACHMGPKIFVNCAGFIKIDTNSLGDSTEVYVEVLDGSRVHPETYEWARKMAVDALEYDDEDANPAGALEEILETPDRLKDLDLDAFAEELERQGFGNKCITLYDIRVELNCRYKDLRIPYQSPNTEKLFDILTKETSETFYVGKLILATVVGVSHRKPQGNQLDQANPVRNDETASWQCPLCLKNDFPELFEVWNHFDTGACPGKAVSILRLDNGLSGYIHIKNLSDKNVVNPEERVRVGQAIHCRIIKIKVERYSVECTSKTSDLIDKSHKWRPQRDIYYDLEAEEQDIKAEEDAKKLQQRRIYVKRIIIHPNFHNISFIEVEKLMQTMKQGEATIRPSSKGADHLTVTWKVTNNIYQHIDVKEEGKENAFSLGRSLWIGDEEFEDLDEIIARYINPMAAYVLELLDFKYYKPSIEGIKDKAEEILKDQKKKNPGGIPYIVSASKNYPGKFLLSYLPPNNCRHEYVTVIPDGFRFRNQMFIRISDLFRWFKEHFRDAIPTKPGTPNGTMTSKTLYTGTSGINEINPDTIQRVAQNMPHHMLHSLSKVANQTSRHYPSYTPGVVSINNYGMYENTPYTPSGQTPFMTPYHTPHHTSHYLQTSNYSQGPFLQPILPVMNSNSHRTARSHRSISNVSDSTNWTKAAKAWARSKQFTSGDNTTPRSNEFKKTSRNQENERATPRNRTPSARTPSYKYRRGTPFTNSSPQSMSLSGDATPLYDES
ncbi:hypothetical protein K0M31_018202 [Melipona bicolor]|uniref:Transcription elongation factor spt6 n=1 Tax=Melipona bicolor TaxID=60889 RepID=A0AA40KDS3_9HYME|nr:hypothetical protein K0M31_018202 [Melipona bicolor]